MYNIFKFRDRKEVIGIILGATCFLPAFIAAYMAGLLRGNLLIGIAIATATQIGWLASITLCSWSLDMENRRLKKLIEENCDGKEL